jgi:hypothetical protein
LVVLAATRQLQVILLASPGVPLLSFLVGFNRVDIGPDAVDRVAQAVTTFDDKGVAANLQALADALASMQAASTDPLRFQARIDDLRALVGGWGSRQRRQFERLQAAAEPAPLASRAGSVPTVGVRPFTPEHLFRDRVREAEAVSAALADPTVGAVVIAGRPGMGKTALAGHVTHALRHGRWVHPGGGPLPDGLVFLSTRTSSGITSDEIVVKLAQVTGRPELVRIWAAEGMPLRRRVAELVEVVEEHRLIVLLDNAEDLLDNDRIADHDLAALVEGFILAEAGTTLLFTSRESVVLEGLDLRRVRVVELRSGLPQVESIGLLRELDPQGEYGLAGSSAQDLGGVARRVHGIPRALQLVVSLLANDPLLSVADLVEPGSRLIDDSLDRLISDAHALLDEWARWVLLTLAVLGRPVTPRTVDHVVRPLAAGIDVPYQVRRLARMQIVSVDRATKSIALHPADREYQLRLASDQRPETLRLLNRRAAEHYLTEAPSVDAMASIEDARPLLFAFEHFVAAGDTHSAVETLDRVDAPALEHWGQYRPVLDLRRSVANTLTGGAWVANALRIGRLLWLTGRTSASAQWLGRAEAAATAEGDAAWLPAILVDLAASRRDAGGLRASLTTFRRALALTAADDAAVACRALVQLTHVLRPLGFLRLSLRCTSRVLALSEENDAASTQSRFLRSSALINAAITERLTGHTQAAEVNLNEARRIAASISDRGLEAYARCCSASMVRAAGDPAQAIDELLPVLEAYEEIDDEWGLAACLAALVWAFVDLLDVDAAQRYIERGHAAAAKGNRRARGSLIHAEAVMSRRTGDLVDAVRRATDAAAHLNSAGFLLYGAAARCDQVLSELLAGRMQAWPSDPRWVVRATPLIRAYWATIQALTEVRHGPNPARRAVARAVNAVAEVPMPQGAVASLLVGTLAALAYAATPSPAGPPPTIAESLTSTSTAPGLTADHRSVLAFVAASGLPGAEEIGSLVRS